MTEFAGHDPNLFVDFNHEWPNLPPNFAARLESATKVTVDYEQTNWISIIVGNHSMDHADRVVAFAAGAAQMSGKVDTIDRLLSLLKSHGDPTTRRAHIPNVEVANGPNVVIDVGRIERELAPIRAFYAHVHDRYKMFLDQANKPGNRKPERNALWEALFVAWGALLKQEFRLQQRGVVEFVQLASEGIDFARNHSADQIARFWNGDKELRRRVKSKVLLGEFF